jgi:tRNA pseudouridine38-40 synthase
MLQLSYIGSSYNGSQKSSFNKILDIDTVQGAVESSFGVIKKIIANDINLVMAERTGTGVHALSTAAHIDLEVKHKNVINSKKILYLINKALNKCNHEITISSFYEVNEKFHARFSLKRQTYLYRFLVAKNPEDHQIPISEYNRALHVHAYGKDFNFERMKKGIDIFKRTTNIKLFSNQDSLKNKFYHKNYNKNTVKSLDIILKKSEALMPHDPLSEKFNYWNFIFKSKSFLYHQICQIVGILIALGYNNLNEQDILQVPLYKNCNPCVLLVPPYGLYLLNVEYDQTDMQDISEFN